MEQEHFNGSTGFKTNKRTSCWAFRCEKKEMKSNIDKKLLKRESYLRDKKESL
jgi:hypothetical protein